MEKEKFEEIIKKLGYKREKWLFFQEIDRILLASGKGIYPNWKNLKFLITKDNRILIRHGSVKPYGARLMSTFMPNADFKIISFPKTEMGIGIESSSFYNEWFRQPRFSDVIRATEGTKTYGESVILDIRTSGLNILVELSKPLVFSKTARLSFYDPSYLNDRDNCIHSSINEGIYMHFSPNASKDKNKKFLPYHETIKYKDIQSIELKVGQEYLNKTYRLE